MKSVLAVCVMIKETRLPKSKENDQGAGEMKDIIKPINKSFI